VPIVNERLRRSYFGALNVMTGRVIVESYDNAKGRSFVCFLTRLLRSNRGRKIVVFLDGAGAHRCTLVKEFLAKINRGKTGLGARLLLVRLAPNAPEENPIEDVWLQGKTHIRQNLDYEDLAKCKKHFGALLDKANFLSIKSRTKENIMSNLEVL